MTPAAGIPITIALLVLNGFFVAAEFALVAARRSQIELRADSGSRRARTTLASMQHLSLMLAGAQLGITVASLALGAVSEPAIAHLLEPLFDNIGIPHGAVHPVAFVIALALVTLLHVVLGEMVPKNISLTKPDVVALWLVPALRLVVFAFRPVIWGLNAATNLLLRAARISPTNEVASTVTSVQLAGEIDQSGREGLLDADEVDLLSNALSFENATAAAFTLPFDRVRTLGPHPSVEAVEALAADSGFTRFPLRDGDRLLGYVHLKDVLDTPGDQRALPIRPGIIRPLPVVSGDQALSAAVDMMRAQKAHMAQVVDARGRPIGVITLDDLLKSLTTMA